MEDGIYFSSLTLNGVDWYEYYNSEFTAYTIKIIYNLPKRGRTNSKWKTINQENMYLKITYSPKFINFLIYKIILVHKKATPFFDILLIVQLHYITLGVVFLYFFIELELC